MVAPIMIVLTGAAVAATSLHAQNQPVTYPVHGVVQDSISHQPIARALVHQGSNDVLTDNQGHFELDLPQGTQQLAVLRPGYRNLNQNHSIVVGPNTPDLTFELTPRILVSGQVTLSSGEPADSIPVRAFRRSIVDSNREKWLIAQFTNTSSSGSFRMPAIERGGSYIFCSAPTLEDGPTIAGGSRIRPPDRFGYRPTCFPGPIPLTNGLASDHNSANTLTLTAGQQTSVELQLIREPFFRVMIPILNASRYRSVGFTLHSATEPDSDYPVDWNSKLGYAEAYLPNGQYFAEAFSEGDASAFVRINFRVANKPLVTAEVALLPLHPIPVEIHKDFTAADDAQGIAHRAERESANDPGVGLALSPADEGTGAGNGNGGLAQVRGSSDSTQYQLTATTPGRYWVQSYATEGYVSSITSGGVDLNRQPLIVGPGNSAAPILVTLRNDVGHIQVTVNPSQDSGSDQNTTLPQEQAQDPASAPAYGTTSGSMQAGELRAYYVYAIPTSRVIWQIPQNQGQSTDPLTIDGLAPGPYCVVAFDHAQEFNLNDPETIASLISLGKTITVSANGTTNVQLTIHHTSADEPQSFEAVD
jgi:hypothetical protein